MDEGIKLGIIFLIASIIAIGIGYYYFTQKLPKE